MWIAENWKDYECIDTASGEKLERWQDIILCRPDPQVIWDKKAAPQEWKKADAHYYRSSSGGGKWEYKKDLGYDKEGKVVVIKDGEELYIVEKE